MIVREVLSISKALSDENRVRVLMALRAGELCLCQIIELLRLAPSTASKHLTLLYQAGLVERRKEGKWHYFQLPGDDAPRAARSAVDWLTEMLADEPLIIEDAERLNHIRKKDLLELSACYRS